MYLAGLVAIRVAIRCTICTLKKRTNEINKCMVDYFGSAVDFHEDFGYQALLVEHLLPDFLPSSHR